LKIEVRIPPSPSILASFLYEGLLKAWSICSSDAEPGCLKNIWSELEKKLEKRKITFRFVGNDMKSVNKILDLCKDLHASNLENEGKGSFHIFVECIKKLGLKEISISQKIFSNMQLIGNEEFLKNPSKAKQNGYSFQIMKTDRYQGIVSLELGLINEQITVYSDLPSTYLFFLGLVSSLVADVNKEEYYFLLFDPSVIPQALERPTDFISFKKIVEDEVSETISSLKGWSEEILTLFILLNPKIIEEMKSKELGSVASFRLLRIKHEGNAYKVYNDIPFSIYAKQKIYENLDIIRSLHKSVKDLTPSASKFLRRNDDTGEGLHSYLALKHLYAFVTTADYSFLARYYRELWEAYKGANKKASGENKWYLAIASRFFTDTKPSTNI